MKIHYIIARKWSDDNSEGLCVYIYFTEVHYGTEQEVKEFAASISKQEGKEYKVYPVAKTPLE
jgi:hypothetical protein